MIIVRLSLKGWHYLDSTWDLVHVFASLQM